MNDEIKPPRPSDASSPCCDASGGPSRQSAVSFATQMRIHVALATRDIDAATRFYSALFDAPPTKTRPRYAKFELAEPPLNLSLNEVPGEGGLAPVAPHHLGIQVKSTDAVEAIAGRMLGSGLEGDEERQVACCYAVQDKIWFTDPDGHRWEVFVVTEAEHESYAPRPASEPVPAERDECCEPKCCG